MAYLESEEDLKWLEEVHGIDNASRYASATIYGNEDSPTRVELHHFDFIKYKPVIWEPDTNGKLQRKSN